MKDDELYHWDDGRVYKADNELYHSSDELYHYGVLGMKWGVRRNPTKAYAKATKKLNKLKSKADKNGVKTKKYYEKSGGGYITDIGKGIRDNQLRKSRRAAFKANRYDKKATKWQKAMNKEFAKEKMYKRAQLFELKGQFTAVKANKLYSNRPEKYRKTREKSNKMYEQSHNTYLLGDSLNTAESKDAAWNKANGSTEKIYNKYEKQLRTAKNYKQRKKAEKSLMRELEKNVYR